jgi:polar amino acid transport system permease protein
MTAEAASVASREEVIERLARGQARARRLFRAKFTLTWVFLIAFFGVAIWIGGRVDPEFIARSGPLIVSAAGITIFVCLVSIVLATALAIVGAMARLSTNPYISAVVALYISVVRGTPLLVQIIFIFYGLPQLGIVIPAIPAGIFALSFNYGAYMTEVFRAGIQAVPRGQREAAAAMGMSEQLIMRRIVLPQATRIVIPAIGNDFIAMMKDSALLSVIAVQELLWWGQRLGRSGLEPMTGVLIAAVVYWALTIVFSLFQEHLERRLARSDR